MARTTTQDAVAALDAIKTFDPEQAHIDADAILLEAAHPDVTAAYKRCAARSAGWWYA